MPYRNIGQFQNSTLPTATIMNMIRDNLRYLKGLDGAGTIEDDLTVQGLFSADSMRFPRMTTTQRDALTQQDGLGIYNTSVDEFQMRVGGSWENMTAVAPVNEGYTTSNLSDQGQLAGSIRPSGLAWDAANLLILSGDIYSLARDNDGGFTPANASLLGDPGNFSAAAMTWDDIQLVIVTSTAALITVPRNAGVFDFTSATNHGNFGIGVPAALVWDDTQLVLGDQQNPDSIHRLPRNADGTYTPANVTDEQAITGITNIGGLAWDGLRLLMLDSSPDKLFSVARDNDGGYTGSGATDEGNLAFANSAEIGAGMTWDGGKLVIGTGHATIQSRRRLYTLPPDYA